MWFSLLRSIQGSSLYPFNVSGDLECVRYIYFLNVKSWELFKRLLTPFEGRLELGSVFDRFSSFSRALTISRTNLPPKNPQPPHKPYSITIFAPPKPSKTPSPSSSPHPLIPCPPPNPPPPPSHLPLSSPS